MLSRHKGFSLLELLVAMAVGYFLITVLFSALWVIYNRLSAVQEYNSSMAAMAVAHDIMKRDLEGIPCQRSLFKRIAPDALIWPSGNGADCGYEYEGLALKRIEGHYDAKTHEWHGAARSTILNSIGSCRFDLENSASLIQAVKITVSLRAKRGEINDMFTVAVRNRQIG